MGDGLEGRTIVRKKENWSKEGEVGSNTGLKLARRKSVGGTTKARRGEPASRGLRGYWGDVALGRLEPKGSRIKG